MSPRGPAAGVAAVSSRSRIWATSYEIPMKVAGAIGRDEKIFADFLGAMVPGRANRADYAI
jgi:hypothetical protein